MCTICLFDPPAHAPWCPIKDQDALREMARKKAENFQRIAELESENSKLKVSIELARSDALSNLERLISVEAENKRLREALREIMETDSEHLSYRIARRALAAPVGKYAGQPEHEAAG